MDSDFFFAAAVYNPGFDGENEAVEEGAQVNLRFFLREGIGRFAIWG